MNNRMYKYLRYSAKGVRDVHFELEMRHSKAIAQRTSIHCKRRPNENSFDYFLKTNPTDLSKSFYFFVAFPFVALVSCTFLEKDLEKGLIEISLISIYF